MIAYRAEVWCDGLDCRAGSGQGIAHDDPMALPQLTKNLTEEYARCGWLIEGDKAFCPKCVQKSKRGRRR